MLRSLLVIVMLFGYTLVAQVTFIVDSLPAYTQPEDILYIAGDFQGWIAGDPEYALQKNESDTWWITLDSVAEGTTYAYKFTRGDWGRVEKGPNGEEINNRVFTFGNGDTVHVIIHNWADGGGGGSSTAAENVIIMDEDFYIPQLDRNRRIWLYLPPDYQQNETHYPVLYMHDGQNLFDQFTAFSGEWEVDETLNDLAAQGYQVPIVVGIDNGGIYRIDELTPWNNTQYGGGQGDEYMAFIVETLKPYIDLNYRTLPGRENTGIIGSSLGGLISTYGTLKYQDIFSKSGPFSPAYWINFDSIFNYVSEKGMQQEIMFYQNIGGLEGNASINTMYQMEDSLKMVGFDKIISKVIPDADHNEQTWRDDFAEAYLWLYVSYANNIKEGKTLKPLVLYPNPAVHIISIKNMELSPGDQVKLMDTSGSSLVDYKNEAATNEISISPLKSGNYILRISREDEIFIGKFVKF